MKEYEISLPDPFPTGSLKTKRERHLYKVYASRKKSQPNPKDVYTLEKAPVEEIISVVGTYNGISDYEFTSGTDYKLVNNGNDLEWQNNERPDPGTPFFVTYRSQSILSRYTGAAEEELDTVDTKVEESIESTFIESASNQELDEIGELFGDVIGDRAGRDDPAYKNYLKSVVQAFNSRGTTDDIAEAVAAAIGVDTSDVDIPEDFSNASYDVATPVGRTHKTGLVYEIADIADPSGVKIGNVIYKIDDEEMSVGDEKNIELGKLISEDVLSDDGVTIPSAIQFSESSFADETVAFNVRTRPALWEPNPNDLDDKTYASGTFGSNTFGGSGDDDIVRWERAEWVELKTRARQITETSVADDTVSVAKNPQSSYDAVSWDTGSWT